MPWIEHAVGALSRLPGRARESAEKRLRMVALGQVPSRAAFVPGRIELVGKHTDYAGGRSITCAVTHGFVFTVYPETANLVHLEDPATGVSMSLSLNGDPMGEQAPWSVYPITVLRWLARNDLGPETGLRIRFSSNLAPAAGLSSSSALSVGLLWALLRRNDRVSALVPDRRSLAVLAGAVEMGSEYGPLSAQEGVGTRGGMQDQLAIVCAQEGYWRRFDYATHTPEEAWPMPAGHVFVIGVSGVHAEKTGGALEAYNRASDSAAALAALWRARTGGRARHLADVYAHADVDRLAGWAGESDFEGWTTNVLQSRLAAFRREYEEVVPGVGDALARGDVEALGRIVDHSMAGAVDLLGNQVPETTFLAQRARQLGAAAASAFGAGFGGAVWAMVREEDAESFRSAWQDAYAQSFPDRKPTFLIEQAGPGAFSLVGDPFWAD